jgi:formate hydrogenlyase transcriptional activator
MRIIIDQQHLSKVWERLEDGSKDIFSCLAYLPPPVSIDTLITITNMSVITVLNAIEKLKAGKIVYEKKGYGKGKYFIDNPRDLIHFVEQQLSDEKIQAVLRRVTDFCTQFPEEGEGQILIKARLCKKLGEVGEAWGDIEKAADILYRSGNIKESFEYYDYLAKAFLEGSTVTPSASHVVECIIRMVSRMMWNLPINEQISLLTRAQEIAAKSQKLEQQARTKAMLARALQISGENEKASVCLNEFSEICRRISDPNVLRVTMPAICDALTWEGKFAEVVTRYEETIGNMEEFTDDETYLRSLLSVAYSYNECGKTSRSIGMLDILQSKANLLGLPHLAIDADTERAMVFSRIGNVPETEACLDKISHVSEDVVGIHMLLYINTLKVNLLCVVGKYNEAFALHRKTAADYIGLGWARFHNPMYLENCRVLESKSFHDETMSFDSEFKKAMVTDSLFVKGIALRCKAFRQIERRESLDGVLEELNKSENYLKSLGAELELARTRIVLGRYYLCKEDAKASIPCLEKAWATLSNINKELFPQDLLVIMPKEQRIEFIVDNMIQISESLATIHDRLTFLEKFVDVAMQFTMATRAAFFIFESGKPNIKVSRSIDESILDRGHIEQLDQLMTHTAGKGAEFIFPRSHEIDKSYSDLFTAMGIDSIMFMPVRFGQQFEGYLYLVNPSLEEMNYNIPYVRLLCNQVALGLFHIDNYEEAMEQKDRLKDETIFYKREMGIGEISDMIIGRSEGIKRVFEKIRRVAPTDSAALILGETGVGKELVAKSIHNLSKRKDGPYVSINLATLPPDLVISELFGHEKGAFTGAHQQQKGRLELARGGTLFLDEIGDLPLGVQVQLLRVLQEGTFERLGSAKTIRADFRLITATNRNLALEIENGKFRADLYYRLDVFPIHVPPLRERKEDIPLIARHFVGKCSQRMGKRIRRIESGEMKKLMEYGWPGNVRELEHLIERVCILSDEGVRFTELDRSVEKLCENQGEHSVKLAEIEREHIERILASTHWKVRGPNGAAEMLGLKPTTLFFRMKKLGIPTKSTSASILEN